MTCHTCKKETNRVVECRHLEQKGLCCPECEDPGRMGDALLHQSAGNSHAPKMTEARKRQMLSRQLGTDGKLRPAKRWR